MIVAGLVILTLGLLLLWGAIRGGNPATALRDLMAGDSTAFRAEA